MEIIRDLSQVQWNKTSITLGKFDGVHTGHRMLIDKVLEAEGEGCTPTVFTFDRFPSQFLLHQSMTSIFLEEEKQNVLRELGIKRYILFPFHEKTAAMEPEEFVKEILVDTMKVAKLYVGTDFRFGKGRKGDATLLKELSEKYGFYFEVINKRLYQDREVSSTRIREAITKGEMEAVTEMLGMPYQLSGEVIHGKNLGHKIGIPTINQSLPEGKIMPALGVYCARVTIDGTVYNGIANVGSKPTVQEEVIYGLETHLFDCNADLYGKHAKTELLHFIRPEQKFSGLEGLMQQLDSDKLYGRSYFKTLGM